MDENVRPAADEPFEVVAPGRAIGLYEGGLVPVEAGNVLLRVRAKRIVVATGAIEQPLVFPGNDLVGVMLPDGALRLIRDFGLKPGERAVVIAADARGLDAADELARAGVHVVTTVDLREREPALAAEGRRGILAAVTIDGIRHECDLLLASGTPQPAYSLLAQAGARVEYEPERGIFVPRDLPDGVEAVGRVTGELGAIVPTRARHGEDGFVCVCEDVGVKDLKRAHRRGLRLDRAREALHDGDDGPVPGALLPPRLDPRLRERAGHRRGGDRHDDRAAAVGAGLARAAGGPPARAREAHGAAPPPRRGGRRDRLDGRVAAAAQLRRCARPRPPNVHEAVGVIDVSTLGKLLVAGPDAAAFLERLYPNRFADLAVGRVRYGVLSTDAGRIMDDGTIGRLADDTFYVTTTSTGADGVLGWFEWWNAVWRMDVEIANLTGALAAVNVAGPRSRELLAGLTDADVSADGLKYLDAREAQVAGVPCLLLRIGFVGELGYELHFPSTYAEYLWDTLLERGAKRFGLEAQRILRLEKQHIIIGQDTDSESNVLDANMAWLAKLDKDDFVGKWALEHMKERGPRELLVGFEMEGAALPAEGCQAVRGGPARRARDERAPQPAARQDGRPRVAAARPGRGGRALRDPRRRPARAGARAAAAVLRPRRRAAAVVSLAFLSPSAARAEAGFEPRAASPLARALAGAEGIDDLSLLGKLEVRGPAVGALGATSRCCSSRRRARS